MSTTKFHHLTCRCNPHPPLAILTTSQPHLRRGYRTVPPGDAVKRQSDLHVVAGLVVQQFIGGVSVRGGGGGGQAVGRGGGAPGPLLLADGHGQRGQADVDILEGVQQEDAHDDGDEAAEGADDVVRAHVLPLLEEDGRTAQHRRGEEHVVDGRHQRGVEDVQRLVQVVDLRADAGHQAQQQHPEQRVGEHRMARDGLLDADAQTLDAGHGQRSDH